MPETRWRLPARLRRHYQEVYERLPSEIPRLFVEGSAAPQRWRPSWVVARLWGSLKCWMIRRLDGAADWLRHLP